MKLSIGEVSKIFDISRETLRFYDKIGILTPEVNKDNGYRYYQFKHLEKLSLILGIKLLGISLSDIKETIESESLQEYTNLVLKQEEILQIKKKELEVLEYNLEKSKYILNTISNFNNEYNFENIKVNHKKDTFYEIDVKKLLSSDLSREDAMKLEKELSHINEKSDDVYIYPFNITNNDVVEEDDSVILVKKSSNHRTTLEKYLEREYIDSMKKVIDGNIISTDFYGTVEEISNYILSLNKYFNCAPNNIAYVTYNFYLPRKLEAELYFVNINIKI